MKKRSIIARRLLAVATTAVLVATVFIMAGCASTPQAETTQNTQGAETTQAVDVSGMDFDYTDADKNGTWDDSSATHITLASSAIAIEGSGAKAEGSTLTVTAAGTYVVSGTLSDGQIVVDTGTEDKVRIVLDGVDVTCGDGPALYVKQADKVFVTLASGTTNALADAATYSLETGEDEPNATLFSKDDLTINGSGSLTVTGSYRHAICSKDDLVITGGTLKVTAAEDGLHGRDCVKICGGTFDIAAAADAIKSSNDEEATRGFVSIDGGTISIDAGDDAVHAETVLNVNEGTIDITSCYEGFEAQAITINGGSSFIKASDDGINAVASTSSAGDVNEAKRDGGMPGTGMFDDGVASGNADCSVVINGGYTVVDASGDGIDSNGSLSITGGVTLVSGPTNDGNGALDWDLGANISGGTFLAVGSSGMAQTFDSSSTQAFVTTAVSGSANNLISITDASGNVLCSMKPTKSYAMVVASTPSMSTGATYAINLGGTASGADSYGYASGGTLTGAVSQGTVEAGMESSGNMGMGAVHGGGGGMGDAAGGPRGGAAGGPVAPSDVSGADSTARGPA